MSCWVYTFVLSNFVLHCIFFSWRHSGWLYAQAWKCKRGFWCFFSPFFGLYCNNSFCFRASDSRISVVLLCLFLFLFILNHSFSVVSARSWYHSSACNHNNSLIMFIDFNIETIKPLAPHSDS